MTDKSTTQSPLTAGCRSSGLDNSQSNIFDRLITQEGVRARFDTHSITVVTTSIRISLWISAVGFVLDMIGYLLFYRLFLHQQARREDVVRFAFVPEMAALIFGVFTWLGLLYSGIIGEAHFNDNVTCSKIALSLALSVNFIMDTSLGFVFDHFVFSHHEISWQNECVLSKLMSLACLVSIVAMAMAYSYCRYGRIDQGLIHFTRSILSSYHASYSVFENNLGEHSPYVHAETSCEAIGIVVQAAPRIVGECFFPISYWRQANIASNDNSRSSIRYDNANSLIAAEEQASPRCCC